MELSILNLLLVFVVTVFSIGLYFIRKRLNYFKDKDILHLPSTIPWGNFKGLGTKRHMAEITQNIYNKFKGKDDIVGMMLFLTPVYLVISPELIKNIFVRDFSNFQDRGFYYNEKDDPISARLFALDGEDWKKLRAKQTPAFTSGKIKMMFDIVVKCGKELANYIEPYAERGETVEMRDVFARYSTDVIANIAFGLETNSIKDPQDAFRQAGKKYFSPSASFQIKLFFGMIFPKLARSLKIKVVDPNVSKYFFNVIQETLNYRKTNNVQRNDYLQLLSEIEVSENIEKITAQSFGFYLGGFETSSTTMSFCLYELAKNQNVQERVRDDVLNVLKEDGDMITYENLFKMEYLTAAIDETIRLYPVVDNISRRAAKSYSVPNSKHVIPKGAQILIPAFAIQRDENYFTNPDKFDPNRFYATNKNSYDSFTYFPFGKGPRDCIGKRFGIMLVRIGLVNILRKYKVSVSDQTPQKVQFDPGTSVLSMKGGVKIKLDTI